MTIFTLRRPCPAWEAEFLEEDPPADVRPVGAGPGPVYHVVVAEFPDGSAAAKVRELPDFLTTGDRLESLLLQIDDSVAMQVRASGGPDEYDLAFERVCPEVFGPVSFGDGVEGE